MSQYHKSERETQWELIIAEFTESQTPREIANAINPRLENLSFSCTSLTASIKDNRDKRVTQVYMGHACFIT